MIKVYTRQDLEAQLKKNRKVLAIFYATWCPYCVGFVPKFNKKVSELGFDSIVHVLLDDYENPLWDEYDIPAVPTIILFEDGEVCERLDGRLGMGLSEKEFRVWIEEISSS